MFCKVYTASCVGIEGRIVQVEADLSNGLPSFHIVGEVSGEVRESAPRIYTALRNSGYGLPPKRYVVNLSPADFRKAGTGFDLPIAVALLCCVEQMNPEFLENSIFIGELGLSGKLVPVKGILSMVSRALECGFKQCFVPVDNAGEAVLIHGMKVYGIRSLQEMILHLQGRKEVEVFRQEHHAEESVIYAPDFGDIRGQEMAKRCIQISAAGHHHLLMIGPPGSGKTMMAERMPYILPPMSREEQLMVTKIHSAAGKLKPGSGLIRSRPFRRPHHTLSDKGMIGGGAIPVPGEVSLAHGGILFLDEFGEFSRGTLESLREPLETGEVFLHRVRGEYCFPAHPLIVGAMNPCRCGYYPDRERCRCTASQIHSYMSKISGPVRERMDLCVHISRVDYRHLSEDTVSEDSNCMRERIAQAYLRQEERFKDMDIRYNSEMNSGMTECFCKLDEAGQSFMAKAYEHYHFSARIYQKILKVARTISDLDGFDQIGAAQLAEAVSYRLPDEDYGGGIWN